MCNHVHVESTQLNGKYDYYWILLVILVLRVEETVFMYLNFNSYAGIKILLFVYSFSVFWTKRGLLTSSYKSKISPEYVCVCIYTHCFLFIDFIMNYSDLDEISFLLNLLSLYWFSILLSSCFIICIIIFLLLPFTTMFGKSFGSFFKSLI